MKNILTKSLPFIFFCSTVMPMEQQKKFLIDYAIFGNLKELKKLIEDGMDPNTAHYSGSTLLYLASEFHHLEIV